MRSMQRKQVGMVEHGATLHYSAMSVHSFCTTSLFSSLRVQSFMASLITSINVKNNRQRRPIAL